MTELDPPCADWPALSGQLEARGSEALVAGYLGRIAAEDGKLGAFMSTNDAGALAFARACDARRRAGSRLGPVDGVPAAIKDLVDIEGEAVSMGSRHWLARRGKVTATIVHRMLGAGMPILGRTRMVEFACGGWGTNARLGTPLNPWDVAQPRAPGGSSSGSGVAVAAGLAPLAIGTDTGGSVRLPAAMCGITGLKVTQARISRFGILPLSQTLDSVGPMTRCARGAAAFLDVLAGPDARDPTTLRAPAFAIETVRPERASQFTIAVLESQALDDVDPEVATAFEAALRVLEQLGCRIVRRRAPEPMTAIQGRCGALIMAEGYTNLQDLVDDESIAGELDPNVRARILGARDTSAAEQRRMLLDLEATRARWAGLFDGVDILATPTTPFAAPSLADYDEHSYAISPFTRPFNYLEWCALALPMGFSREGLPLSLQLVGKPFAEAEVLSAGCAFQDRTDWHKRLPAI